MVNGDAHGPDSDSAEIERETYLRVKAEYDHMMERRPRVNRGGIIFIGASAVVFLALMFSLESKLFFLVLWIAAIIFAVAFLIHNEYKIYKLSVFLGYENESEEEAEEAEEEAEASAEAEGDDLP